MPVAFLYCAIFVAIALAFPSGPSGREEIAFQLTMPGLEEEPFYRAIPLFALDQAFTGNKRFLGVDWGWGAVLSCFLFGMAHAFGFSHGSFSFEPMTMALTAIRHSSPCGCACARDVRSSPSCSTISAIRSLCSRRGGVAEP